MSSFVDGWRRVLHAPMVLVGVFVITVLAALPLALSMRALIDAHLGPSLMANQAADGVNWDWWQEFASQATGLGTTFTPSVIGFAATLDGLSDILDARPETMPVRGAIAVYLAVWLFISGGVIDRYARQRRTRAHGFFAASGVFVWRFLRLGIIAGLVYAVLFFHVYEWLFDTWLVRMTRDLDVERTAFLWRAGAYSLFGLLLVVVNVVIDYAKVRLVVEDRRSAVGALLASLGFILRNPLRVCGLYALNSATFLVAIGVWALIAPGAGGSGLSMWLTVAAMQAFIVVRLAMKLQFLASETALFQSRLAHARYAAAPVPQWPDSPAAELIQ